MKERKEGTKKERNKERERKKRQTDRQYPLPTVHLQNTSTQHV